MSVRDYAEAVGKAKSNIDDRRRAASVSQVCPDIRTDDKRRHWQGLAVIAGAPDWLRSALAAELVARGWTVEATRGKVAALKDAPEPPAWADADSIAGAIVSGAMKPRS